MDLNLRKATVDDGPFLLALRNSDDVRPQSRTKGLIAETAHLDWLRENLDSSDASIWIIERAGQRAGYIRAKKLGRYSKNGIWLLSIALESSSRGQGYGCWAVKEFCRLMRENFGACDLVAEVLATNGAACRLFQKLGFIEVIRPGNEPELIRYELHVG